MDNLEKISKILLNHKGKNNKITSKAIADKLGIIEDDTYSKTRKLILESAEKYKLPLAANNNGYYLICNDSEYMDYMKNLDSRIEGINLRKNIITRNYRG